MLQAARILEGAPPVHFLFLGDGSTKAEMQRLAAEMQLRNVTFREPVPAEELPPYYSIAECGLAALRALPTHEGARPSKILPVLASGKPLIFVGRGEGARLMERAEAGIVVPPEDPQALAREILRLFGDRELALRLGANGRRFVETHFQWSRLVSDWLMTLRPAPAAAIRASATP